MTALGDTMELTPDRGPTVKIPSKTADETIAFVRDMLEEAYIDTIAVELPLQRKQTHDDEEPKLVREWAITSVGGLLTAERASPRVRYEPVGATVIIRDGQSTPWVLIDPAYIENPVVRELLRNECAKWTPEVLADIRAHMDRSEEGLEKARRAKATATRRKNAATRAATRNKK